MPVKYFHFPEEEHKQSWSELISFTSPNISLICNRSDDTNWELS